MHLSTTLQSASAADTPKSSPCHTSPPPSRPYNPYARIPSRRAIACVTCAKAKTKCDKSLPACSRCVAKGITCEPRSTRRTSDNSYRSNGKKAFVSPKLYHSSSTVPPRSMPTVTRPTSMRPTSHMDFCTVVKRNQQPSSISGLPMLVPLPTYASQMVDEYHPYTSSPEPHMDIKLNSLSGRSTPQTPESISFADSMILDDSMSYMAGQPWTEHAMAYAGLDFGLDSDVEVDVPELGMWATPEPETMMSMSMSQLGWPLAAPCDAPPLMLPEAVAHTRVSSLASTDGSVGELGRSSLNSWSVYRPAGNQFTQASMATPAHLMRDVQPMQAQGPIWEDVFITQWKNGCVAPCSNTGFESHCP